MLIEGLKVCCPKCDEMMEFALSVQAHSGLSDATKEKLVRSPLEDDQPLVLYKKNIPLKSTSKPKSVHYEEDGFE